jgi:xanthine dehydrogenase accessory factor
VNELDSILSVLQTQPEVSRGAVLTTVVHVKGSAYRRPGARMLIFPDGRRIGSISGGCLEGDVCRKAWWFTEGGNPSVRVYDTSSEDDAVWEFGLGCNGVVHVLFERVGDRGADGMLRFVAAARTARRAVTVATVVGVADSSPVRLGDRLLFDAAGVRGGALAGSPLEAEVLAQARECFLRQKSHLAHLSRSAASGAAGGYDVFLEWIGPPPALVVFGAGHDAQPLVRFAKEIGWHVTLADGRANYATPERFPDADRVVVLNRHNPLKGIEITRETAVVMMTHNYPLDAVLLRHILPAKPRYLGMLGPQSRTENLLEEVGMPVTGIDLHAPVGLDLGSDAPVSIALAIVAEIQAALHGRVGGMLKNRQGPIHDAALESGAADPNLASTKEAAACELV